MAQRRLLAVAGVCLLATVAGCGFPGLSGGDGTNAPDEASAPGIDGSSVTDFDALVRSHQTTLEREGFVYEYEYVEGERHPDTALSPSTSIAGTVRATTNFSTYHTRRVDRLDDPRWRTQAWYNGTVGVERRIGDETSFVRHEIEASNRLTMPPHFSEIVENGEWAVADRTSDRIVLRADPGTLPPRDDPELPEREIEEYSGRIVVDGDGYLRRVNVTVAIGEEIGHGQDPVIAITEQRLRYNVTRVGDVATPPPDWIDRGIAATRD